MFMVVQLGSDASYWFLWLVRDDCIVGCDVLFWWWPFSSHTISENMSVRPSTIKRNVATSHNMILVEVDKTCATIWLLRSSEVKVKVTGPSNLRKWPKSKSISSAICGGLLNIVNDYDSTGQHLNLIESDFSLPLSFSFHGTSNLIQSAYLH